MSKPYYDHDSIWSQRATQRNPVWGSFSHVVYSQVLERIQQFAPNARTILDVGCGAGAFGTRAKEKNLDYVGIDASSAGIELGRHYFAGVDLRVSDFAKYPAQPLGDLTNFSVVTCINVLHCLVDSSDRHNLLRNLFESCGRGGHLVLTTMIGPVPEESQDRRSPRAYLSSEKVADEIRVSGWNVIDITVEAPRREDLAGNLLIVGEKP